MTLSNIFGFLFDFAFFYPFFMAYLWIMGATYYFFYREKVEKRAVDDPPLLEETPGVTFIVPCHDEGPNVRETIGALFEQVYPDFEVVAIDDASNDETGQILDEMALLEDRLRVIHFDTNQGKAMGLRAGALAANNEILICIDGDAILDPHAAHWLTWHFVNWPRVGAVTGNPRVRNRTSLLGKIQAGEFSSIIGLIKRAQRIYGRVFTVSGVVAAFRRSALQKVGYWNLDMVTEDIDISWSLQTHRWDVRYEPNALCYILMPETFKGLWSQRLRWAQGGIEVLMRHFSELMNWRNRRMWIVALELIVSTFWAYTIVFVYTIWLIGQFFTLPPPLAVTAVLPGWSGVLLGSTCLLQFLISLIIDSRYESNTLGRYYYWMIWYPMVYWSIQAAASCAAVPRAIRKRRGKRAVWVSPDRGFRPQPED
ncbi:MAG: poly-beta-1,6-N-acetyl-D-glucosamine synthase [Gammaproteobacteria bacterium]|nr:poly-beta-1,6-N-acetyl-D-glucosamine synthase [Gammaproteobacteria bacterium]